MAVSIPPLFPLRTVPQNLTADMIIIDLCHSGTVWALKELPCGLAGCLNHFSVGTGPSHTNLIYCRHDHRLKSSPPVPDSQSPEETTAGRPGSSLQLRHCSLRTASLFRPQNLPAGTMGSTFPV